MHPLARFRLLGLLEGYSLLALLLVGMPIKYAMDQPLGVRILGPVHGVLFILYCMSLMQCLNHQNWSLGRAGRLFLAAFIPGGTLYTDRGLKKELAASATDSADPEQA